MAPAMLLSELFARNSRFTILNTSYLLNKYIHLIDWKENPRILEFGFGDGGNFQRSLKPLVPKNYEIYVASDISKDMLDYAKSHIKIDKGEFCQLDIESDNVPDTFKSTFDHIFSFFTFHLIHNHKQAFKNVYNMLQPGGQTIQIMFDKSPLDDIFYKLSKHPKWGKYEQEKVLSPYYFNSNPRKTCEKDLKEAGFKNMEFRIDNLNYEFPNEENWKGLYLSVNTSLQKIPKEEVEEYKEYYFNEIKKHVFTVDEEVKDKDVYKVKYTTYIFSAKK